MTIRDLVPIASRRGAFPFVTHRTMAQVTELEELRLRGFPRGVASPKWQRMRALEAAEMRNNPPPPTEPDDAA
jgi:hypothetical protein